MPDHGIGQMEIIKKKKKKNFISGAISAKVVHDRNR